MESRVKDAVDLFMSGYNCSQSVFVAYSDLFGMEREQALRLSCSMGGGMGRMREVCGTVSAMAMVAGLVCGSRFLTREQMIRLIHAAGEEQDYELAQQILWRQNKRFPEDTGFEELEL